MDTHILFVWLFAAPWYFYQAQAQVYSDQVLDGLPSCAVFLAFPITVLEVDYWLSAKYLVLTDPSQKACLQVKLPSSCTTNETKCACDSAVFNTIIDCSVANCTVIDGLSKLLYTSLFKRRLLSRQCSNLNLQVPQTSHTQPVKLSPMIPRNPSSL